jgi:hypothetical protein
VETLMKSEANCFSQRTAKNAQRFSRKRMTSQYQWIVVASKTVGWGHFFNPLAPYMILWEGIRSIVDRLNAPGKLSQADAEKIRKMIEAGRNQRVDAMEMERSRNVAMGFSVNNVEGAAVTVGSKGQTKYVMKRKDKDDE